MWGCNYNGAGFGHWLFGGGVIGLAITILIVVIIAALIVKLINSNLNKGSKNLDKEDSYKLLRERFAKGEINDQEYQKVKDMLRL